MMESISQVLEQCAKSLTSGGKNPLVDFEETTEGAFVDVQSRQMGKEIVSNEDVEKNEVVDDTLQVVFEGKRRRGHLEGRELEVEILAEEGEVHEEEVL